MRDGMFEYRSMTNEVLLQFGFFNTASNVVFSLSTVAFALLMSKASDMKLFRWSNTDFGRFSLLFNHRSSFEILFNVY